MRHPRGLAALLAIPMLALAACGSSDKKSSDSTAVQTPAPAGGGGGSTVVIAADPHKLAFDKASLRAKAGKVLITMANPGQVAHAIAVEGNGVDKDGPTVSKGGTSQVSVDLKPGKYEFYCPVADHKAQGMKGTLTVN